MITPTERTTLRRLPKRGVFDRDQVNAILDEGLIAHLSFLVDGSPAVVPTGYCRDGDWVYFHGSRKNRSLLAAIGADVCVAVTLIDGLVMARTDFHHSFNYRSVILYGKGEEVVDPEEKRRALLRVVEHIIPGRTADSRPPNQKELDATLVVKIPIEECSAKVRTGPPIDDEEDLSWPAWAGVIEISQAYRPKPENDVEAPEYVKSYKRP